MNEANTSQVIFTDSNKDSLAAVVDAIRITQSINTANLVTRDKKEEEIDHAMSANKALMDLFQNGQGCNLTLFNANVLKEGDAEQD